MKLRQYVPLIITMSGKDGIWITLFYALTVLVFKNIYIFGNHLQLTAFIVLGLLFSFVDEKISLKLKRWQYAPSMPTLFGVGLTPLLEIAVTGIITFLLVFNYIN